MFRIWTERHSLVPTLNESDCDSCSFTFHHNEEDSVCQDNRNKASGKEITHSFSVMPSAAAAAAEDIAAVIQNRWSGGWGPFRSHNNRNLPLCKRDASNRIVHVCQGASERLCEHQPVVLSQRGRRRVQETSLGMNRGASLCWTEM